MNQVENSINIMQVILTCNLITSKNAGTYLAHSNREFFYNRRFSSFKNEKKPQPTQRRRKDVVKRLIFGLKDVLDWSEMEIAMNFFYDVVKTSSKRRPRDAFHEMS